MNVIYIKINLFNILSTMSSTTKNTKNTKNKILDDAVCDIYNKDWQGGKSAGTIFKRKSNNIICVKVGKKTKTFNPTDYKNEGDAMNDALKWKLKTSDKLGLTK